MAVGDPDPHQEKGGIKGRIGQGAVHSQVKQFYFSICKWKEMVYNKVSFAGNTFPFMTQIYGGICYGEERKNQRIHF